MSNSREQQTSGLVFGGLSWCTNIFSAATEEYNGSGFLVEELYLQLEDGGYAGAGTQTAALFGLGYPSDGVTNVTEEYNGTSWTTNNTLITRRFSLWEGGGIQTSALAFGGRPYPDHVKQCKNYDGSSWTSWYSFTCKKRLLRCNGPTNSFCSSGALGDNLDHLTSSTTLNMMELLGQQVQTLILPELVELAQVLQTAAILHMEEQVQLVSNKN